MNKQFSFSIKVRGSYRSYSFYAPVENGFVYTNRFCPKELYTGDSPFSSLIVGNNAGETEGEFNQDCQRIVNYSNATTKSDIFDCLSMGLYKVVVEHINRCGRLLFFDLLIYVDCFAYLLNAVGYTDAEIKRIYPIITKETVDVFSQYVKDSHTMLPFHVTNTYSILNRLAAQ